MEKSCVLALLIAFCTLSVNAELFITDKFVFETYETYTGEICLTVDDVFEEAGLDVVFPDVLTFDGKEYKVVKMDRLLGWSRHDFRSLTLGKYMIMANSEIEEDEYERHRYYDALSNLEEIKVNPGGIYESHNGCLYGKSGGELVLEFVPKKYRNRILKVYPGTKSIWLDAIRRTELIEVIEIPSSLQYVFADAILENRNLKKIAYEGKLLNKNPLRGNKQLREVSYTQSDSTITSFNIREGGNISKVSAFKGTKVFNSSVFNEGTIMFIDLPDVERINGEVPKRNPQAVMLGDKDKNYSQVFGWSWLGIWSGDWLDKNKAVIICLNSSILPIIYFNEDSNELTNNWIIYVPEDGVERYKLDPYWNSRGEILPITDKLIPLVSEPELEIEQYLTHEYLWDVMALGDAVAAERGEWSSDDPSVATIDENGVLTAVGQGVATITFTLADTEGNLYTAESKVTVVENVSGVEKIEDEPVVVGTESTVPDGVYDLHGRRVGDTPEGLAPGLYIVRHLGKTEKRLVR